MKFGKKLRTELSPHLLRCSLDYKALKRMAKEVATGSQGLASPDTSSTTFRSSLTDFFRRVEAEKEKVAAFYHAREAWCFLSLDAARGALFRLTRTASRERLAMMTVLAEGAEDSPDVTGVASAVAAAAEHGQTKDKDTGDVEGRFLTTKASMAILLSESEDLVKFAEMNMNGLRKLLKKLDKWTGCTLGLAYFRGLVDAQPWISGVRAHGILRMASTMAEHLRGLRPALKLGPAAGGPEWADRIVYSVGSFDQPGANDQAATEMPLCPSSHRSMCSGANAYPLPVSAAVDLNIADTLAGSPTRAEILSIGQEDGTSPLRFLREFGAVVVVGVYTDAVHAATHDGVMPVDSLEARFARVVPHCDRVVTIDTKDPETIRAVLLGSAPSSVPAYKKKPSSPPSTREMDGDRDGHSERPYGRGTHSAWLSEMPQEKNCCFVMCDWEHRETEAIGEAHRLLCEIRKLMEEDMHVFRMPSPTWARVAGEG